MRNFTTHTPTKQGVLEAFPSAAPSSNARWQKNQPRPALALTAGTSFGPFGKRVRMLDTNVLVAAEETDLVYVRQPVSVFKQLVEAQRMWDDPDIMPESDVPLGSSARSVATRPTLQPHMQSLQIPATQHVQHVHGRPDPALAYQRSAGASGSPVEPGAGAGSRNSSSNSADAGQGQDGTAPWSDSESTPPHEPLVQAKATTRRGTSSDNNGSTLFTTVPADDGHLTPRSASVVATAHARTPLHPLATHSRASSGLDIRSFDQHTAPIMAPVQPRGVATANRSRSSLQHRRPLHQQRPDYLDIPPPAAREQSRSPTTSRGGTVQSLAAVIQAELQQQHDEQAALAAPPQWQHHTRSKSAAATSAARRQKRRQLSLPAHKTPIGAEDSSGVALHGASLLHAATAMSASANGEAPSPASDAAPLSTSPRTGRGGPSATHMALPPSHSIEEYRIMFAALGLPNTPRNAERYRVGKLQRKGSMHSGAGGPDGSVSSVGHESPSKSRAGGHWWRGTAPMSDARSATASGALGSPARHQGGQWQPMLTGHGVTILRGGRDSPDHVSPRPVAQRPGSASSTNSGGSSGSSGCSTDRSSTPDATTTTTRTGTADMVAVPLLAAGSDAANNATLCNMEPWQRAALSKHPPNGSWRQPQRPHHARTRVRKPPTRRSSWSRAPRATSSQPHPSSPHRYAYEGSGPTSPVATRTRRFFVGGGFASGGLGQYMLPKATATALASHQPFSESASTTIPAAATATTATTTATTTTVEMAAAAAAAAAADVGGDLRPVQQHAARSAPAQPPLSRSIRRESGVAASAAATPRHRPSTKSTTVATAGVTQQPGQRRQEAATASGRVAAPPPLNTTRAHPSYSRLEVQSQNVSLQPSSTRAGAGTPRAPALWPVQLQPETLAATGSVTVGLIAESTQPRADSRSPTLSERRALEPTVYDARTGGTSPPATSSDLRYLHRLKQQLVQQQHHSLKQHQARQRQRLPHDPGGPVMEAARHQQQQQQQHRPRQPEQSPLVVSVRPRMFAVTPLRPVGLASRARSSSGSAADSHNKAASPGFMPHRHRSAAHRRRARSTSTSTAGRAAAADLTHSAATATSPATAAATATPVEHHSGHVVLHPQAPRHGNGGAPAWQTQRKGRARRSASAVARTSVRSNTALVRPPTRSVQTIEAPTGSKEMALGLRAPTTVAAVR